MKDIKQEAEEHREKLVKQAEGMGIPWNTARALARWAVYAGAGGHFITAVIKNDFVTAVTRADLENLRAIDKIAIFIYNYMPDQCWGSEKEYKDWPGLYQLNIDQEEKNQEEYREELS